MFDNVTHLFSHAIIIGVGATAFMDLCAIALTRVFGIPSLDYRLVGRWIGLIAKSQFFHRSIAQADEVNGEALVGWAAHYLIGIVFAAALLQLFGMQWLAEPILLPALVVGVGSVCAPFFIMQPAFGAGIAAAKTPAPWKARSRSLLAHTMFGLGLYLSALLMASIR